MAMDAILRKITCPDFDRSKLAPTLYYMDSCEQIYLSETELVSNYFKIMANII